MTTLSLKGRIERENFGIDVELESSRGQTTALIGPNGSGKSTILRAIAGLESLTSGQLMIDGQPYDAPGVHVAPPKRSVGVVFQDLRLFDHLSVKDNVGFGLDARGVSGPAKTRNVGRMLDLFELGPLADRRPPTLSGGQQARVAFARAAAIEPAVLLLDEPFGAIDVETRQALRAPFAEVAATTAVVLVTHDQVEARVLADQLVVLDSTSSGPATTSIVAQAGSPDAVAARPQTSFAAELLGTNLLTGTADDTVVTLASGATLTTAKPASGVVHLTFSPTAVSLHRTKPEGASARNLWSAEVGELNDRSGPVLVRLVGDIPVAAMVTPAAVADLGLAPGKVVWASVKATEITVS